MKLSKLENYIPYCTGEKLHVLSTTVYPAVDISMPGRHQGDTATPGGDGVVLVTDPTLGWVKHPFTHNDIFGDIETKKLAGNDLDKLMQAYYSVVVDDEEPGNHLLDPGDYEGMHPHTFIYSTQVLALFERRRYGHFESKGGGAFTPLRFSLGIADGSWSLAAAVGMQRRGRVGVEILEKKSMPKLTKQLLENL